MKAADGRWAGFSVELWQAVAQHLNVPFEFREFSTLENLIGALEKQEIDIFPSFDIEPLPSSLYSGVSFQNLPSQDLPQQALSAIIA